MFIKKSLQTTWQEEQKELEIFKIDIHIYKDNFPEILNLLVPRLLFCYLKELFVNSIVLLSKELSALNKPSNVQ